MAAGGTPDPDDLRDNMRGSRLGVPFPSDDGDDEGDPPADPDGDEDQDHAPDSGPRASRGASRSGWQLAGSVQSGAGWVLGLLLWGWIGLPLIQGGPARVGKVLRAKFTNKAPGGAELP